MATVTDRDVRLGDVADLIRGVSYRPADLLEGDPDAIPLLRATNIGSGALELADVLYVPPGLVRKSQLLRRFDVAIAMSSGSRLAVGRLAQLRQDWAGCVGAFCAVIRADPEHVDPEYLGYVLQSPGFRTRIETYAVGTAIMNLSRERLLGFPLRLPEYADQLAIAHILGTLDDKIESNRRMNETLEAIARGIFESWFVDFDPVRASAEGRNPSVPESVAGLFADRMVESSLGPIPMGWTVTDLGNELAVLETGGRPAGGISGYATGVPSIGAESIIGLGVFDFAKTKYIPHDFFDRMPRGKVESRDVMLYKDGGRPGQFEPHVAMFGDGFPFAIAAINEHVYRLRARQPIGQNFLYFWLTSPLAIDEMRIRATGVAVPGLNSAQVRSLPLLVPPKGVLEAFDRVVEPMVARILLAALERKTLVEMRDVLLPTLISGDFRLRRAERLFEAARA